MRLRILSRRTTENPVNDYSLNITYEVVFQVFDNENGLIGWLVQKIIRTTETVFSEELATGRSNINT